MLVDIHSLPRVADPDVTDSPGGDVSGVVYGVGREDTLLRLVLVLSYRNKLVYQYGTILAAYSFLNLEETGTYM